MAKSHIIPCLRYRDAPAAIEWLCRVFGFEKHAVFTNDDGTIAHAELRFGNGMVMLGSVRKQEDEFGSLLKQPDEFAGLETQSPYVIVEDSDAVYQKVKQAGGEIVIEINDTHYGSRDFSCRDPEGRLWNFGTYDPWASGG